jgi:triphosphoribosyl-dephospho-CoA synthase
VSFKENPNIIVKSIDDIIRCITLSSLLEVAGWPKPGNIHRFYDSRDTRFEHFLAGIASIQPPFYHFCEKIKNESNLEKRNLSYINLGKLFKDAAREMMRWQKGGNTILGHILILAPLAAATVICMINDKTSLKQFRLILEKIIKDTTVKDTLNLYEAINLCNPGGLGTIDKYDLNDKNSLRELKQDHITLEKIFNLSQGYDLISKEYSTGFTIILREGVPYYSKTFYETRDINIACVHTFLYLLANHTDTLIIRKSGSEMAKKVSEKAQEVLEHDGLLNQKGTKLLNEMDKILQEKDGKLNPGTTADLLAGIIYIALICGLKY